MICNWRIDWKVLGSFGSCRLEIIFELKNTHQSQGVARRNSLPYSLGVLSKVLIIFTTAG
jgi:hypothetical protein